MYSDTSYEAIPPSAFTFPNESLRYTLQMTTRTDVRTYKPMTTTARQFLQDFEKGKQIDPMASPTFFARTSEAGRSDGLEVQIPASRLS